MGCTEVRALLADYLEDALPPDQAQQVEAHLQVCPVCVRERRALERTTALLRQWSPIVPSERIWAGIEERLRARGARQVASGLRLPFARRYRLVAALAAIVVAVLVAFFMWSRPATVYPPLRDSYTKYWQAHHQWAIGGGVGELYPYVEAQ